jgi:hypothetical protein
MYIVQMKISCQSFAWQLYDNMGGGQWDGCGWFEGSHWGSAVHRGHSHRSTAMTNSNDWPLSSQSFTINVSLLSQLNNNKQKKTKWTYIFWCVTSVLIKPVFRGHPGDQKKVSVWDRWLFRTDCFNRECSAEGPETDCPHKLDDL